MSEWRSIDDPPAGGFRHRGSFLLKRENFYEGEDGADDYTIVRYVHVGTMGPFDYGWSLSLAGVQNLWGGSAMLSLHPPTHYAILPGSEPTP